MRVTTLLHRGAPIGAAAALLLSATAAQARITRIVIDKVVQGPTAPPPSTTPTVISTYETITGRAFGELDPNDPHNAIITDVMLGRDSDGKVRFVTTFYIVKPKNPANASGLMWHDVPNRGGRITIVTTEQNLGDIGLSSGWQSDNAGGTSVPPLAVATSTSPQPTLGGTGAAGSATSNNEWVIVPVAKNPDPNNPTITGYIQGRIVNRSGPGSQPLNVMGNPIPYLPASLDTNQAILKTRTHETLNGRISEGKTIPSTDWAFAHCDATNPFPGTPDDLNPADLPGSLPVHVCLKSGFDPTVLYELVYPVKNPYVLGVGFAAFRDVNAFFSHATADDFGNANPIANTVRWSVIRGVSQSGNATRAFIHLGFNQDESNRQVHDGAWPIIAGRRVSLDSRWAQPDGVLELYQMGSEGPQWWVDWPDRVRHLPTTGILARCRASNTCPKVIEHFGGSEVFALKMTTEWVGTSADVDIPLPDNVRRYYVPSTTHGGGNGTTTQNSAATPASCPGNNWGPSALRANPVPETQLVNVLRLAMRNWVMNGTPPPASRWPKLADHTLVDPTPEAMHFPKGIPAIPPTVFEPENFVNPVFDYQWGPFFNETDATGVPTDLPPRIKSVIKMKVPRVDSDGNELGGVPTVQREVPLGTYLGWNVTVGGFHEGQVCNYVGGLVPFATTRDQRIGPDVNMRFRISANGKGSNWSHPEAVVHDPRLSLEERYQTHAGYVAAVTTAANHARDQGYLLAVDAAALIAQATASDVLNSPTNTSLPAFGEVGIEGHGEGDLKVNTGDTVLVNYSLSLPGRHAATTITVGRAIVTIPVECQGHHGHHQRRTQISVNIPDAAGFPVAQNSSAWVSNTDFAVSMPDLCNGGTMKLEEDATFTAMVGKQ